LFALSKVYSTPIITMLFRFLQSASLVTLLVAVRICFSERFLDLIMKLYLTEYLLFDLTPSS
jgi:hypothetical protein